MDQFQIYLPSNACKNIYPNNASTDYKTRFDRNIQLDGEWEVGVESIFYASQFEDTERKAQIHCSVALDKQLANDTYESFKFELAPDNKWKGFSGVMPRANDFEADPNNTDYVLQTLWDLNSQMLKRKLLNRIPYAFYFSRDFCKVNSNFKSLYIRIGSHLANVLGYAHQVIFNKFTKAYYVYDKPPQRKLRQKDYWISYFCADVQRREKRIMLKPLGEAFEGGKNAMEKLWKEKIEEFTKDLRMRYSGTGKHIVDNYDTNYALTFSRDFGKALGHPYPIFGEGTTWALHYYDLSKGHTSEEWYVDIYSREMKQNSKDFEHFVLDLYPWQFKTMTDAMANMNDMMMKMLKTKLRGRYSSDNHRFHLSLTPNGFSSLELGSQLQTKFSPNLYYFVGLGGMNLQESNYRSERAVGNKIRFQRRLYILSNIIKPTAYAQQQLQILQNFLHIDEEEYQLIEKHFDPIVYQPIKSNNMDMIEIQLTDENFKPLKIDDMKTLVCLYFRKRKTN
jgi:hypothetical protein